MCKTLSEDSGKLKVFLDRFSDDAAMCAVCFSPSKSELVLPNCIDSKPNFVLARKDLSGEVTSK